MKLTEKQIMREARRLFRALATAEARLARKPGAGGIYYVQKPGRSGGQLETEAAFAAAFAARGWTKQDGTPDRFRLAAAGRAWLRRTLAETDPFQAQHRQMGAHYVENAEGQMERHAVNDAESSLSWLRRRKGRGGRPLLSDVQFATGERLRRDFTLAHLEPNVTAGWGEAMGRASRRGGSRHGAAGMSDAVLAARQRYRKAIEAVGPELSGVLVDVCCFSKGLAEAEKAMGWPQRSGKLVLQLALSALARHYGLAAGESAETARMSHWGAAGYRPQIDGAENAGPDFKC